MKGEWVCKRYAARSFHNKSDCMNLTIEHLFEEGEYGVTA
jgi:hypothetical protein